jgi:archaellum component FlaC
MTTEIEGIKALLDAHLSNLRGELSRLATNYDQINSIVQNIQRNTNVAIAEINKDISRLHEDTKQQGEEIKSIKSRIEIGEDVQQGKWILQDDRNKRQDERSKAILGLQIGAIATFITLAIATFWNKLFP